jgi:hypothetical protein
MIGKPITDNHTCEECYHANPNTKVSNWRTDEGKINHWCSRCVRSPFTFDEFQLKETTNE